MTCSKGFPTLELLKDHTSRAHKEESKRIEPPTAAVLVDVPCKCSFPKCGGAQFASIKTLMLHLRNYHTKQEEMVSCIFEDCSSKYDNPNTLRVHFGESHKNWKAQIKVDQVEAEASPIDAGQGQVIGI